MKKTRCQNCGTDTRKGAECCHYCGSDIPPQNGVPREETLRSSDWVAELEAARSTLWTLWEAALEAGMRDHKEKWKRAEATLEKAIATERSRSATESSSATTGAPNAPRKEQP